MTSPPVTASFTTRAALTPRALLIRGMLVGVAAGALAFLFARLFGEAPIDDAIAFEAAHTHSGADEPEIVSRAIQSTLGLGTAVVVYGTALGGIFALAFAVAYGRLYGLGVRATAVVVAGAGFAAVSLVPLLKYPPNPPAVGNPDTIGRRTALYFLLVAISVAAAVAAALTAGRLTGRFGTWNAAIIGAGVFVAVIVAAMLVMPAVNETPADFPATVLWRFRLASVGTQLVLWTTMGLLFGALTERRARRDTLRAPATTGG